MGESVPDVKIILLGSILWIFDKVRKGTRQITSISQDLSTLDIIIL